jgi:hypothetical protein
MRLSPLILTLVVAGLALGGCTSDLRTNAAQGAGLGVLSGAWVGGAAGALAGAAVGATFGVIATPEENR